MGKSYGRVFSCNGELFVIPVRRCTSKQTSVSSFSSKQACPSTYISPGPRMAVLQMRGGLCREACLLAHFSLVCCPLPILHRDYVVNLKLLSDTFGSLVDLLLHLPADRTKVQTVT